ncbi:callose synthase 10-like isoform X2 [Cucurbita maxima]|uniref:Callose synthase 10-like isoform X2 n=1 Tax=Cucurbita maxima TaxID=3661 RepID=A0A6J1JEL7_CUCMA|nr:callose synthase 10-like isoform X2 [Cucurbita maxima]
MPSSYFTTVGYYACTMMTVLVVYIFLYGRVYLVFSGQDEAISRREKMLGSTALDTALNARFLFQIGVFTAVPLIMGFILQLGLLKARIQTLRGQILETTLTVRFFIFQYGIVYKLHLTGKHTSLAVTSFSWLAFSFY